MDLSNPFFYFEGKVLTGLTKYFHKIRSEKYIRRKLIRHIKKLHSRHDMKREFTYEILLYDSLIRILKKFCLVKQFKLSNCIPRIGLLLNSCQNTSKAGFLFCLWLTFASCCHKKGSLNIHYNFVVTWYYKHFNERKTNRKLTVRNQLLICEISPRC